jgi:hypothetical protein
MLERPCTVVADVALDDVVPLKHVLVFDLEIQTSLDVCELVTFNWEAISIDQ